MMVVRDPHADFLRARRHHLLARAARRVAGRRPARTHPRDLGDDPAIGWRPMRLRPIALDDIVGTVDATPDFDAAFRPATDRIAPRWERIARARREGRALEPISVVERPDGYYVLDGRHRVSVARALGHADIDAWTSPARPTPPTTEPETPMPSPPRHPLHQRPVHLHTGDHGRPYV
jgi:hypothetical protein